MKLRAIALVAGLLVFAVPVLAGQPSNKVEDRDRIPELKEEAGAGLTDERVKAVKALGSISDEDRLSRFAVPDFLLEMLQSRDNNSKVREASAEALARIVRYVPSFTEKALRPLIVLLQDRAGESPLVRSKVAETMSSFLDPQSIAHKIAFQALNAVASSGNDDPGVTAACLLTLGKTGYADAMSAILGSLKSRDQQIRAAGLEALKAILVHTTMSRPNDVVTQLVAIITDGNVPAEVRIIAMQTLVQTLKNGVDPEKIAGPLVSVLNKACDNKEAGLAEAVVLSLYRVPSSNAIAGLEKAYKTFINTPGAKGFENVRIAVAKTLGEYFHPLAMKGDRQAGARVAALLTEIAAKEPQGFDRAARQAVTSLGLMDSRKWDRTKVAAELVKAMTEDPAVRKQAHESLVRICGRDLGEDPKNWKTWIGDNSSYLGPR